MIFTDDVATAARAVIEWWTAPLGAHYGIRAGLASVYGHPGMLREAFRLAMGRHEDVEQAALAIPTARLARREARLMSVNARYAERRAKGIAMRKAAGWRDSRRTPHEDCYPR